MTKHIAMLRGINVSGSKPVKMETLRASLTHLGLAEVKTYIQSGNVVFTAAPGSTASLVGRIKQRILQDFGFDVPVLLRSAKEVEKIVRQNPLLNLPGIDHARLHVTFLADEPPAKAFELLQPLAVNPEQFVIMGREIYLYCPAGYGNTKLSNLAIEKKLSLRSTTRNWKTVNTLLAMAQSPD
jgi:uncharacterized protein (DUF1697 family)